MALTLTKRPLHVLHSESVTRADTKCACGCGSNHSVEAFFARILDGIDTTPPAPAAPVVDLPVTILTPFRTGHREVTLRP